MLYQIINTAYQESERALKDHRAQMEKLRKELSHQFGLLARFEAYAKEYFESN